MQSLDPIPTPKAPTEQYPTPAGIAAEVVYLAATKSDITGRSVVDFGCGNGVLAIGAKILGAAHVVGIDADAAAIEVARRNAERVGVEAEWRHEEVRRFRERVDTVLMNPPFGSQTHHADRPFFEAALSMGGVVYAFSNAKSEAFVNARIESRGARITDRIAYSFPIPRMFPFHREEVRRVDVVLRRIEAAKD